MPIEIEVKTEPEDIEPLLFELAALRIRVFRDWPYLYDGDHDYEARYLEAIARAEGAVIVVVRDGSRIVGAATGVPLAHEHAEFLAPFSETDFNVETLFYNCESILLPEYRGRGLYRRFFDARENWARQLGGFEHAVFCGVVRPDDHPLKPLDARPLDPVWRHFGYRAIDGLSASFSWKDVDQAKETVKPLQFWIKPL